MSLDNDSIILDTLLNKKEQQIKFDIYLNNTNYESGISAEFKIGLKNHPSNKLNIIKDIKQFLVYYENNISLKYSSNFSFDINVQKLSYNELSIINFIYSLIEIDKLKGKYVKTSDKLVNGKFIHIPEYLLREFMYIIKDNRVFLNEGFYTRPADCEIILGDPYIELSVNELSSKYSIELKKQLPYSLNKNMDILLDGTIIYLPTKSFIEKFKPYYLVFKENTYIEFRKEYEDVILKELIPSLKNLCNNLILDNKISKKVILADAEFLFYFDKVEEIISLEIKVKYENIIFNINADYTEKIIYRNTKNEQEIISLVRSLGFDIYKDNYYLNLGDEYSYNFFRNKIYLLQDKGQVYYSENFKGIKYIKNSSIIGTISHGKFDYFELKFNINGISNSEIKNILYALKNNLKYYKLESGDFLSLETPELINFLNLIDILNKENNFDDSSVKFDTQRCIFAADYIKENKFSYIKGINLLKKEKSKISKCLTTKFDLPNSFNGELRPYQIKGFNYLKSLELLGFGGILGDEMGLGKTIQVIAFLSSLKEKRSIIIVPSSLLFNWLNEINEFNPNLSIKIFTSSKDIPKDYSLEYMNYDITLITYTLLRANLKSFSELIFDFIIIDEAQNIKNTNSQNSKAVKSLNGKVKFALTGTPLENSLMELWSIFDFIMPGYLYDKDTFNVKFNKRIIEEPALHRILNTLISPFILRRLKKDVLKELPPKIEKTIKVQLPEEQKKIYSVYTDKVISLLENKRDYDEYESDKIKILSYITKLRQIALDPSVVMNDYIGESGKIESLVEILNQSIDEGHKVLVFSQFTSVLKNIKKRLQSEGIDNLYLDGSISKEKRNMLVNEFNNSETPIFLISLKAGGVGLNLQSADVVILFDPWWNPALESQATDRAHRIGQNNIVEVIKLISKDTIEEKVLLMQSEKKMLMDNVLNNDSLKENTLYNLSIDDILTLLK